jgi:serine phosphatase RsbU (regulator of sigma subunit)
MAALATTAGLSVALGLRAWKEWRARDALQAEFEAAREVQQRLVTPATDVPGFEIESAYLPAIHVGGDFFYIRPENPGGLLVVVGDVSGKGLRAAMTVSAIMGALRTMPSLPPTRILGALNRGLVGQLRGGFVTCCATRIEPDGTLTLANAGHLAPYRSGEEVSVAAGLPLGVDADIQYCECQLPLREAETLTFMSDGVVEARKPTGELFGFERVREISGSTAAAIAAAAQAFGQEDDITVVQLRRVAPESEML